MKKEIAKLYELQTVRLPKARLEAERGGRTDYYKSLLDEASVLIRRIEENQNVV